MPEDISLLRPPSHAVSGLAELLSAVTRYLLSAPIALMSTSIYL